MPVKFRPTESYKVKGQPRQTTHYYIKMMTKDALLEYINSGNALPKRRAKCINDLERRGVKLNHLKELSVDGKKITKTVTLG